MPHIRSRVVLSLIVGCAVAVVAVDVAAAKETKLRASVGPGFSISLKDEAGANVTTLAPGVYEIEVEDKSDEHNFHLIGPGVDVSTTVAEIGSKTFTVTLAEGRYTFQCDPHPLNMRGSFTVGSGGSGPSEPNPPATPPASAPVGSKLLLTAGPGFTIALRTATGKAVKRLRPGRYTFVVRDRSAAHNAHLRGAGVNKATSVAGTGTQTWKLVLRKGTLTFVCDPHASSMRGSVTVG